VALGVGSLFWCCAGLGWLADEAAAVAIAKQLCTLMGHASITQTLDRYGHLFPGSEGEAAAALDAYIEGAADA
jgi:hypothetical protein